MNENVELIRLEREIKEKSHKLEIMQAKFQNLQQVIYYISPGFSHLVQIYIT